MSHSICLPLFKRVDAILHESILFSIVSVFSVVLTSEHLFLLLQIRVFAGQSQQVKVEERVLLRQLDNLVLH